MKAVDTMKCSALFFVGVVCALCLTNAAHATRLRRSGSLSLVHMSDPVAMVVKIGSCGMNNCRPVTTLDACRTGASSLASQNTEPIAVCKQEGSPGGASNGEDSGEINGEPSGGRHLAVAERPACTNAPSGCFQQERDGVKMLFFNEYLHSNVGAEVAAAGGANSLQILCMCEPSTKLVHDTNRLSAGLCGAVGIDSGKVEVEESAKVNVQSALGEKPFLELHCPNGLSIDGLRGGERTASIYCGKDGELQVKDGQRDLGGSVPKCQPISCDGGAVSPGSAGESLQPGLVHAALSAKVQEEVAAKKASNLKPFVHGTLIDGVECALGHSMDARPPADDASNTKMILECRAGGFFALPGSPVFDNVLTEASTGEVGGITCAPVACPTTAAIFQITTREGATHFEEEEAAVTLIECNPGYEMCISKNEEHDESAPLEGAATPCAPENRVFLKGAEDVVDDAAEEVVVGSLVGSTSVSAKCTATGVWKMDEKLKGEINVDTLTCKPVECKELEVGTQAEQGQHAETGEALAYSTLRPAVDAPDKLKFYTFMPDVTADRYIQVACSDGHSFDGTLDGGTEVELKCGAQGALQYIADESESGTPPSTALCKPMECLAVQHPYRRRGHTIEKVSEGDEAVKAVHSEVLDLPCPEKHSYDGRGRQDWGPVGDNEKKSPATTSNYERFLTCNKGKYSCSKGWCEFDMTAGAHSLACKPIKCNLPSASTLDTTHYLLPVKLPAPEAQPSSEQEAEEPGTLAYVVGEPVKFQCKAGYIITGSESRAVEMTSTCMEQWKGPVDTTQKYAGWDNGVPMCQLNDKYCDKPIEYEKLNLVEPTLGESAVCPSRKCIGQLREVTCITGHTWDTEDSKVPTVQKLQCKAADDDIKGAWTQRVDDEEVPVRKCTLVECFNPPNLGNNLEPRNFAICTKGAPCIKYQHDVDYACTEGFRFAEPAAEKEHTVAVATTAPSTLTLQCKANGQIAMKQEPGLFAWDPANNGIKPACQPVYCLPIGEGHSFWTTVTQSRSVLQRTYEWNDGADLGAGRIYGGTTTLTCKGTETSFPVTCGANGKFGVALQLDTLATVDASAGALLHTCGKQLRVRPTAGAQQSDAARCLTVNDGGLSLSGCHSKEGVNDQVWWFSGAEKECQDMAKQSLEDSSQLLHTWTACGQLRSLRTEDQYSDSCLAPPLEDKEDAPPEMVPCTPELVWGLSDTGTLMFKRQEGGERSKLYHVFLVPTKDGPVVEDYHQDIREDGFVFASPGA